MEDCTGKPHRISITVGQNGSDHFTVLLLTWLGQIVQISSYDTFKLCCSYSLKALFLVCEWGAAREGGREREPFWFMSFLLLYSFSCFFIQASMQWRKQGRPNRGPPIQNVDPMFTVTPLSSVGDLRYLTATELLLSLVRSKKQPIKKGTSEMHRPEPSIWKARTSSRFEGLRQKSRSSLFKCRTDRFKA